MDLDSLNKTTIKMQKKWPQNMFDEKWQKCFYLSVTRTPTRSLDMTKVKNSWSNRKDKYGFGIFGQNYN